MVIGIASDHRGYKLKKELIKYLKKQKYDVIDYGTNNNLSVDYVDYAIELCNGLIDNKVKFGILICGTGTGMSIVANKIKGVMCAKICDIEEARLAREHNNANVISLSGNIILPYAKLMVKNFLKSSFINKDKYIKRIDKIKELEKG